MEFGQIFFVKLIYLISQVFLASPKERQDVAHEVELLSKLSHKNLVQYLDSFSDNIG